MGAHRNHSGHACYGEEEVTKGKNPARSKAEEEAYPSSLKGGRNFANSISGRIALKAGGLSSCQHNCRRQAVGARIIFEQRKQLVDRAPISRARFSTFVATPHPAHPEEFGDLLGVGRRVTSLDVQFVILHRCEWSTTDAAKPPG